MTKHYKYLFILIFFISSTALAGTITPAGGAYAWGENIGWINFSPTNGNVQVLDDKLTGYAWSQSYGWINLSPTSAGVTNNSGVLGGYAWGQSLGYISFSGASISSSGVFTGTAVGSPLVGRINFSCTNCLVGTNWTPSGGGGGGGAGGILPSTPPTSESILPIIVPQSVVIPESTEVSPLKIKIPISAKVPIVSSVAPRAAQPQKEPQTTQEPQPSSPQIIEEPTIEEIIPETEEPTTVTENVGLAPDNVIPVVDMTRELKSTVLLKKLFARTGERNFIDIKIKKIKKKDKKVDTIEALTESSINLIIKPDRPESVLNIKGFVSEISKKTSYINKAFAEALSQDKTNVPGKLLQEFQYQDDDKDNIYEAKINIPYDPLGDYKITNVINYKDSESSIIDADLVVKSKGYFYSKNIFGFKKRMQNVKVSLYKNGTSDSDYELWAASDYKQENPVITNKEGEYGFTVPVGSYYLLAEAKGFNAYKSEVTVVRPTDVYKIFNDQIQLKKTLTFSLIFSIILFIVVALIVIWWIIIKKRSKKENESL